MQPIDRVINYRRLRFFQRSSRPSPLSPIRSPRLGNVIRCGLISAGANPIRPLARTDCARGIGSEIFGWPLAIVLVHRFHIIGNYEIIKRHRNPGALASDARLAVYLLLVKRGPEGYTPTELANDWTFRLRRSRFI